MLNGVDKVRTQIKERIKEMNQDDKVKIFYDRVLEYGQNENWCFKFLQHIMEFFFVLLMPIIIGIGIEDIGEVRKLVFSLMFFMGYAIHSHLAPLISIKEEDKNRYLSDKLKYVPICKNEFFKTKWKVLWCYVMKLTVLTFSITLFIALAFMRTLSVLNLLPIGMGIYGLIIGIWMIKK